ncbi:helicase-associated domain-containing protein [Gemmata sp. JC717]|uniref:helicase-associated domain-containing protein n=1 Tax=Gemmata algarum TaxID=2975278 RepID=UPI0021BB4992|nr:helicase-associated domain-containing protein [Gemmata algarum]MDY3554691.1 helicase-associated domain-containing protein [Gemmata algarum]
MARAGQEREALTAEQAFDRLTTEHLRPLVRLLGSEPPKRKGELVAAVAGAMTAPARLRALYDRLEPLAQLAVREAAHAPDGRYSRTRFVATHGREPDWFQPSNNPHSYWDRRETPTLLVLFFPDYEHLPTDVRPLLRFLPPPDPFRIPTRTEPPAEHTLPQASWDQKGPDETVPVRVRETAREAEADLFAVLRLIDAGKVRVTDKKQHPTESSLNVVAGVLTGGDFYTAEDEDEFDHDPAADLAIKAFAWPMLVQTAGLAEKRSGVLKLTPAGRTALNREPSEVLGKVWAAWEKNRLFDEFARVEAVKGQGRASLTAAATRRKAVFAVLKDCQPDAWFAIDDLWRFMRATERGFSLVGERDAWKLYITDAEYGSLGYDDEHSWEQLQGRFVLALLFEYAATVGLLDVAYVPPQGARGDFWGRWGADDLSCFSRYDGLLYVRINPLGAWVLGQVKAYQPAAPQKTDAVRVLANLDVVATRTPSAADRLTLERFADLTSPAVWKLSAAKIVSVVEQGGRIEELREFLATRSAEPVPATVETFLADLQHKAEQIRDDGPARIIACASAHVAAELANDRQLKGKCFVAGDRLIVREGDLAAVRKVVHRLGYVWPIPSE